MPVTPDTLRDPDEGRTTPAATDAGPTTAEATPAEGGAPDRGTPSNRTSELTSDTTPDPTPGLAGDAAPDGGPGVRGPRPALSAQRSRADALLLELASLDRDDPRRPAVRKAAVEAELPLVHHLAQRFRGRGEPYDDLVQVGTIGLLHAVDRFDPSRGAFTSFAVPTILGEIRRHFRDRGWALRVPRRLQDLGRQVSEAREWLTHKLGRSPTVEEIARHLDTDTELVLEALETAGAYATVPLPATPEEADQITLGSVDEGLELVEQRETLRPLLANLPARERRILALRFVRGLSQSQIAAEVGISQMHVSRLLARSLAAMREGLTEDV